MKKAVLIAVFLLTILTVHAVLGGEDYVIYNADIKPILDEHCKLCHTFAETYQSLMSQVSTDKATEGIPLVDPGKPENSVLIWRIEGETNEGTIVTQMPRSNPELSEETIELFKSWIAQGAYEDEPVGVEDATTTWSEIKRKYE